MIGRNDSARTPSNGERRPTPLGHPATSEKRLKKTSNSGKGETLEQIMDDSPPSYFYIIDMITKTAYAVTTEEFAEFVTKSIEFHEEENRESLQRGDRFSRACGECGNKNPECRSVAAECGHTICSDCSKNAEKCPTCTMRSAFVKLYEPDRNSRDCELCCATPLKRVVNVPCGHIICAACLLLISKSAAEFNQAFCCPFCRSLPTDIKLLVEEIEAPEVKLHMKDTIESAKELRQKNDAPENAKVKGKHLQHKELQGFAMDRPARTHYKIFDVVSKSLFAVTPEKFEEFITMQIESHERENEQSLQRGDRFPRACTQCHKQNPELRSFATECGHVVCSECAHGAEQCDECSAVSTFIRLYEADSGCRECDLCAATPLKRVVLVPCGHIICAGCLLLISRNAYEQYQALYCPFCRTRTRRAKKLVEAIDCPEKPLQEANEVPRELNDEQSTGISMN
ncbi:hypothetical protein PRIPAC_75308 [Pristionchus pacificus]|uniref:Zinc finger protein n=1 Tax=Pristionchus pacificus TaxID=54126 RepID=A0A2A6C0P7_PRIPA|nr:hypothetical protein PRIPAC_75308 [Pristionchus pacificus]|eukprot:PDM71667.1 zinc finger protein [Pristionchus pacificus]